MIENRLPIIKGRTPKPISLDTLIEQVELGKPSKIIITPTDRLARFLRNYEHEKNKGETRPGHNILDYKTWIKNIWDEYLGLQDGRLLLSKNQEQALWTSVIEELEKHYKSHYKDYHIINIFDTAEKLSQARKLLFQFRCFDDKVIKTEELEKNDRDFLRLIKQGQQDQQAQHENDIFPSETLKDDFYANPKKDKDRFFFLDSHYLYQKKCRENNWIDSAELPDIIIKAIKAGQQIGIKDLPTGENREVIFAGFSNTEPQTKALIEALNNPDTKAYFADKAYSADKAYFAEITSAKEGEFSLIADNNSEPDNPVSPYLSPEDEFKACAAWAHKKLSNGETEKIYAILAPNLEEISDNLTAVLDKYLCPEIILPENRLLERPYNISYAKPLASYYIVAQALLGLELFFEGLPIKEMGLFLLSPCYVPQPDSKDSSSNSKSSANPEELTQEEIQKLLAEQARIVKEHLAKRSAIYTKMRSNRVPHIYINVKSAKYSLNKSDDKSEYFNSYEINNNFADSLNEQLETKDNGKHITLAESQQTKLRLSQWPEIFFAILKALHFMESMQSSGTKQLINKLMEAINGLKSLETVCPEDYTGAEALGFLRSALSQKLFQPRIKAKRLQIMGFMEAQGQKFEEVRIINFQDRAWPTNAAPLPYLPYKLQNFFGLPNSSPEANLEFSEHISKSLKKVAPIGTISWCRSNGSSDKLEEYRLSPLWTTLTGDNPFTDDKCETLQTWPELISKNPENPHECQKRCDMEIPLQPDELINGTFKGGTNVIKQWAQCPFKAFAELRLGAKGLEDIEQYPGSLDKGNLVHGIMQFFWTGTFDKEHSPNLETIINNALNDGIEHYPELKNYLNCWKDTGNNTGGCRTQARLIELREGEIPLEDSNLAKIVGICANIFIEDLHSKRPDISQTFLEIEQKRVIKLICNFLDSIETKRRPFKVIAAEHSQQPIKIPLQIQDNNAVEDGCSSSEDAKPQDQENCLKIDAKIDRIDEYDDGGLCIIDYKTGNAKIDYWSDERGDKKPSYEPDRPSEPQVPIYAAFAKFDDIAGNQKVVRASFANISHKAEVLFPGEGQGDLSEDGTFDHVDPEIIAETLTTWKEVISGIAKEFCDGTAYASPLKTGWYGTCVYCKLSSLCRKLTDLDEDDKPEGYAANDDY